MEDKEKLHNESNTKQHESKEDQTGQLPQLETNDQVMRHVTVINPPTHEANVADVKVNEALLSDVPIQHKDNASNASVRNQLKTVDKQVGVGELKNGLNDTEMVEAEESGDGTPSQQAAFTKEVESFYRENALEFKAPKFYGEPLNCLKLWRAVTRLGGYDVVTASKLWRQVGESFHPPKYGTLCLRLTSSSHLGPALFLLKIQDLGHCYKNLQPADIWEMRCSTVAGCCKFWFVRTCTTVSWTFRIFYEKALLEYEKHKRKIGELRLPVGPITQSASVEKEASAHQALGSGRARRNAAARAMQGWHAQRLVGYGDVAEPIIKDKHLSSTPKREKSLKSIGSVKHRPPTNVELATTNIEADKQIVTTVVDLGPPADWVKVNVRETKDCFEVYALVPGLLREEVRVQSDPAGRLVITGQPEQINNPWGITPFKKVVSLPGKIDPLQTSAVVSLHGRLFVRVPFEQ
ncbi:AT-rich interactive domain-containing protein 5-like [Pyrus ussuriensis x Pyrus communis]|uniref:AT-rich interactive domain-containing protein 5-like n=1 Tax=Pyrus ussuriensis x Pyrus communis TaxID=2448454 RepID=A0A5N5HHC1_9ROSA|nr:AT-rich interactive domain-containing protein 5-like [Pyrus ussuriensis x Pyrus communis]